MCFSRLPIRGCNSLLVKKFAIDMMLNFMAYEVQLILLSFLLLHLQI